MREVNDEIHEQLKNLIEDSPMRWTYAILWRCSSPQLVLRFHDGYYRGTGSKPKEVGILGSSATVTEKVTDAERFFKVSVGQSFGINEDLPGYALCGLSPVWLTTADWWAWERAKCGHLFGIKTFLCIPLASTQITPLRKGRVLELASTETIPYHPQWIKHMADFIYPIGIPRLQLEEYRALQPIRTEKWLHERAKIGMHNRGKDNLSKQCRGKEKISDSRCSWPLLSESSNKDIDRPFSNSRDYSGPS